MSVKVQRMNEREPVGKVVHIHVWVENDSGPSAHEGHELTLSEGERFVGIAMVLVNDRDGKGNASNPKQIEDEAGFLMQ